MSFKKIEPKHIEGNVIAAFDNGWGLVTAGTEDNFNAMTISWGQMGCLWNRPVCTVYIRPCRHTYSFTEANDRFTVSLFDPTEYREPLMFFGTKSGHDTDKMHAPGLTHMEIDGCIAYEEAKYVLVVKKLYSQQFDPAMVPEEVRTTNYKGVADDDLHRQYICLIEAAYERA